MQIYSTYSRPGFSLFGFSRKHWQMALMVLAAWLGQAVALQAADAEPKPLKDGVTALYNGWAEVEYGTPDDATKLQKLEPLIAKANSLENQYPNRAEPLVWSGILLGTKAQSASTGSAMGVAEAAKAKLEKAISIDPEALDGAGYTTLGTLYDKVPGWPIGFGSSSKARDYLEKGVAVNPKGMEANYFYGSFLYGQGQYSAALNALQNATTPPSGIRAGQGMDGRKADIQALTAQVKRRVK